MPNDWADVADGIRYEGHAIVSADGMIAAADGSMPAALRNDADWRQFQAALDRSALVVLGRLGHRQHPNLGQRRRLVFTGSVAGLARDADDEQALLFNPGGATLGQAMDASRVIGETVAVTGGTRVFDFFLPLYSSFVLAEVQRLAMPGGRPCFSAGHPAAVLAQAGLVPGEFRMLDEEAAVSVTTWVRQAS